MSAPLRCRGLRASDRAERVCLSLTKSYWTVSRNPTFLSSTPRGLATCPPRRKCCERSEGQLSESQQRFARIFHTEFHSTPHLQETSRVVSLPSREHALTPALRKVEGGAIESCMQASALLVVLLYS